MPALQFHVLKPQSVNVARRVAPNDHPVFRIASHIAENHICDGSGKSDVAGVAGADPEPFVGFLDAAENFVFKSGKVGCAQENRTFGHVKIDSRFQLEGARPDLCAVWNYHTSATRRVCRIHRSLNRRSAVGDTIRDSSEFGDGKIHGCGGKRAWAQDPSASCKAISSGRRRPEAITPELSKRTASSSRALFRQSRICPGVAQE